MDLPDGVVILTLLNRSRTLEGLREVAGVASSASDGVGAGSEGVDCEVGSISILVSSASASTLAAGVADLGGSEVAGSSTLPER